jgi:hypothetical protein
MGRPSPFSLHRVFPELAEEQEEDAVEGGLQASGYWL